MSEEKNENVEAGEEAREEEVLPDTEVIEEASAVEEESLRDQFVRLQADFANFRNRTQRERVVSAGE